MFFSVWLAIWRLKISTFVLIKVFLTYLRQAEVLAHDLIAIIGLFTLQ